MTNRAEEETNDFVQLEKRYSLIDSDGGREGGKVKEKKSIQKWRKTNIISRET